MLKNKRGQFYILAAMIIVIVIAGFATINNYAKKRSIVKLYDVGDELNIESSKVIDYGVTTTTDLDEVIDDFTASYNTYAGEDKEIYFIFGNQNVVSLITSEEVETGTITLLGITGTVGQPMTQNELTRIKYTPDCTSGEICEISLVVGGDEYDFELKPGENFYFILSQEVGDEQLVVQG